MQQSLASKAMSHIQIRNSGKYFSEMQKITRFGQIYVLVVYKSINTLKLKLRIKIV